MASVGPEPCPYCGSAPCVGDHCPQWDQDDGHCDLCGVVLLFDNVTLCPACYRSEQGDGDEEDDLEDEWME